MKTNTTEQNVHRLRPVNQEKNSGSLRGNWLSLIGPGLITAALVFGPSKITITTKLGAEYGYTFLWAVALAIFFIAIFTVLSSRIALATEQSMLTTMRQKWGRTVSVAVGVGVFLVTASFQAGNSIGVGIALGDATGTTPVYWIVASNLVAVGLLFFRAFYKVLEKIMILLIALMLVSFITTVFLSKPDIGSIAGGYIPSIPQGSFGLLIALVASTFSIVGALYQSYLVQEKRRLNPKLNQKASSGLPGILILGIMSSMVLICAAAVLHPAGIKVTSTLDMARALEPLYGHYAAQLFLSGLFAASFSSLIGNASVGGTVLGDALGYGSRLSSPAVKILIALVMIIGAGIAIAFGRLPLELIVVAQSVTILVVPFIGIAMFLLSNDPTIMGKHTSSTSMKLMALLGLLVLIALAVINVKELFFT